MKRTTWFLAGTAAGAYLMGRMRRAGETFSYDGLTDRLAGLYAGARVFGEEIASATAEKETELRQRLGLGENVDHQFEVVEGNDESFAEIDGHLQQKGAN